MKKLVFSRSWKDAICVALLYDQWGVCRAAGGCRECGVWLADLCVIKVDIRGSFSLLAFVLDDVCSPSRQTRPLTLILLCCYPICSTPHPLYHQSICSHFHTLPHVYCTGYWYYPTRTVPLFYWKQKCRSVHTSVRVFSHSRISI